MRLQQMVSSMFLGSDLERLSEIPTSDAVTPYLMDVGGRIGE